MATNHSIRQASPYDKSKYPLTNWIFENINCVSALETPYEMYGIPSCSKSIIGVEVWQRDFKSNHMKLRGLCVGKSVLLGERKDTLTVRCGFVDSAAWLLGIRSCYSTLWPREPGQVTHGKHLEQCRAIVTTSLLL